VILVNGPSSSGKSSICRALLPLLDGPWFLVPVDAINAMRSHEHQGRIHDLDLVLRRTREGYHRAVAALASVGNDVVMDYPLSEPWRLTDLLGVLKGYDVTLVDVTCEAAELVRRERARGDRPEGLAASQDVFRHDDRDLTVDTTTTSPEDCAAMIAAALASLSPPSAFERLRSG
jgi:chloramphenicol 3-O phosphotransferase